MASKPDGTQVIELTAKRWKALQLIGAVIGGFSLVVWIISPSGDHGAAWGLMAGIVLWLFGRGMAWWKHG